MAGRPPSRTWTIFYYALPAFALAVPTIPVYVFLPAFYAETIGLGLAATGTVLLAARILDGVTDPLIGIASDRVRLGRFGRRKPWIAIGGVICGMSLLQLLQPPPDATTSYLLIWAVALYIGWTMVSVPYTAWGAELSDDYNERSRITGAREALMIFGVLCAAGIPAVVASLGGGEAAGLATVAWVAVGAGSVAVVVALWRVPDAPTEPDRGPTNSFSWRGFRDLLRNRPFARLLGSWFVNGLANGFPAVLFPLYLDHALGASEPQKGVLISVYFAAGVVAIPAWVWLSRRFGKHHVWCAAMLMACATFVWVPLLDQGAIAAFFVICVITGMALGADLALPPAMQADVVDYDTLRTGGRRAGLFFAIWSMSTKLALACAVGLAFPALDALGFQTEGQNSEGAIWALAMIYAFVPTVLKLVSVAMMWNHPITQRRQRIVNRRLAALSARRELG